MASGHVLGADECAADLRGRALAIRKGLPIIVRNSGHQAERLAKHKVTGVFGDNSGFRSRSLERAIRASRVTRLPTGWRVVVDIRPGKQRSAWYGKEIEPADYAYFVEHGTRDKVATGHLTAPNDSEFEKVSKGNLHMFPGTDSFRGRMMIFRESRPGRDRTRFYRGFFFRGQRGKHFMAGAAAETSELYVPVAIRGLGTRRGSF